jgi:hypothetical protein
MASEASTETRTASSRPCDLVRRFVWRCQRALCVSRYWVLSVLRCSVYQEIPEQDCEPLPYQPAPRRLKHRFNTDSTPKSLCVGRYPGPEQDCETPLFRVYGVGCGVQGLGRSLKEQYTVTIISSSVPVRHSGSGMRERLLSSVQPDDVRSRRSRTWRTTRHSHDHLIICALFP